MNIIQIWCGLGNQLFQYTFSKYLECRTGNKSKLYIAEENPYLDSFDIEVDKLSESITCDQCIKENDGYVPQSGDDNLFFVGWWQNKEYYLPVADSLFGKNILKRQYLTEELIKAKEELTTSNSVAIHFRRNDYLSSDASKLFVNLSLEYYVNAVSLLMEFLENDNLSLYLFSDDLEFIQGMNNLCGLTTIAMPMRKPHEDIFLMAQAKHHIIANSTFSWWGAALSGNRSDGITIAPKNWYRAMPSPNLYLDKWIKL